MKNDELKKLKLKVKQLMKKRDDILKIKKEISSLEQTTEVKKYLYLLSLLEEETDKRNKNIDEYTDEKIINISLSNTEITPDADIFVYLGTFKYDNEADIIHGPSTIAVSRDNHDADYVLYQNLEAKSYETIQIPYDKVDEFESKHKIIIPNNITNKQKYFYDLQFEYFKTIVFESPEKAYEKINKLLKK